jgi:hypothetical protein
MSGKASSRTSATRCLGRSTSSPRADDPASAPYLDTLFEMATRPATSATRPFVRSGASFQEYAIVFPTEDGAATKTDAVAETEFGACLAAVAVASYEADQSMVADVDQRAGGASPTRSRWRPDGSASARGLVGSTTSTPTTLSRRRLQRFGPSQNWWNSETTSTRRCSMQFAVLATLIVHGGRSDRCCTAQDADKISASVPVEGVSRRYHRSPTRDRAK